VPDWFLEEAEPVVNLAPNDQPIQLTTTVEHVRLEQLRERARDFIDVDSPRARFNLYELQIDAVAGLLNRARHYFRGRPHCKP